MEASLLFLPFLVPVAVAQFAERHSRAQVVTYVLLIVTNVESVALSFGTEHEQPLERLTASEAQRHLAAGQFPPGSMGPKIEAAIEFLRGCSAAEARVIICDIEHLAEALAGQSGTTIKPDG